MAEAAKRGKAKCSRSKGREEQKGGREEGKKESVREQRRKGPLTRESRRARPERAKKR